MELLFIIGGLVGLWLGTKWIINGAMGIADRFQLSHSFVGVAILAVGTDLPEVFVSVKAAMLQLKGIESSGIITGNAIGSSMSQLCFVLGIAGLFLQFKISKKVWRRDGIALIGSTVMLIVFGLNGMISRMEGLVLLIAYLVYYIILLRGHAPEKDEQIGGKAYSIPAMVFYLLAGFSVLIGSSHFVVENAMSLAVRWGVAQSFIGIAIVGLGTSLPELAVTVGAAIRKSPGMSVGNVIGSNIFDGLIPIGLGGLISTTKMDHNLLEFDLPVLLFATLLALAFLRSKRGISTVEGVALVVIYFAYMGMKLWFFEGTA